MYWNVIFGQSLKYIILDCKNIPKLFKQRILIKQQSMDIIKHYKK